MSLPLLDIIAQSDDFLVVNKPAGLVCHPTKGDSLSSLVSRARLHLERAGLGGSVHFVNRLDRETSGLILLATTPGAASELGKLWEARLARKIYLAIVPGHLPDGPQIIDAPLGRDPSSAVAIKDCVRPDGAPARTGCRVLCRFERAERPFSLLELEPQTGRKHQIRIHLAHLGHPLVGEKLYAGHEDDYLALVQDRLTDAARQRLILPCHALHAARLSFIRRGREWNFEAPPEPWFQAFLPQI
jgi:23S rRNA pseudouridine1911/1915/1917 synthase